MTVRDEMDEMDKILDKYWVEFISHQRGLVGCGYCGYMVTYSRKLRRYKKGGHGQRNTWNSEFWDWFYNHKMNNHTQPLEDYLK